MGFELSNKLLIFINFCFVGALIIAVYLTLVDQPGMTRNNDIMMIAFSMFGLIVGNYIALRRRASSLNEGSWRAPQ